MGAVDKSDMIINGKKTIKWYKKTVLSHVRRISLEFISFMSIRSEERHFDFYLTFDKTNFTKVSQKTILLKLIPSLGIKILSG